MLKLTTKIISVLLLFMAIPFLFHGWNIAYSEIMVMVNADFSIEQMMAITDISFFFGIGYLAFGLLLMVISIVTWLSFSTTETKYKRRKGWKR